MMLESAAAMVAVKLERPDDAEIQEMADKIRESNKAKMMAPTTATTRTLTTGPGGQSTLAGYVGARMANGLTITPAPAPANEKKPIDEESQRGRFGWTSLGTIPIPYILRQGEKYSAVRMAESKILNKYLSYLSEDIYNYTNIRSYYITDAESRILNEINSRHCDFHYGREQFTNKDLVVRLQDAIEFHQFLEICYTKISGIASKSTNNNRCGFIRINNDSVVPFTVKKNVKYVPLFYFEGETDALKQKAQVLEGWDLSYLKFCCKVQGIRNELFASETCNVISLDNIKSYFPAATQFDDYWPKTQDCQLISKNPTAPNASWTKQPVGAPVGTKAPMKTVTQPGRTFPAGTGSAPLLSNQTMPGWNTVLAQQQQTARMAQAFATNGQRWPTAVTATPSYYPYQAQAQLMQAQKGLPPPLVRSSVNQATMANAMRAQGNGMRMAQYRGYNGIDLTGQEMANAQRMKNTRTVAPLSDHYYMSNEFVDGHPTPCLVRKTAPGARTEEPLITIQDFTCSIYPNLQPHDLQKILQDVLKVNLYKPSSAQLECLRQNNRGISDASSVALIKLHDANNFMPQLKYVVNNKYQTQQQNAKRMRIS